MFALVKLILILSFISNIYSQEVVTWSDAESWNEGGSSLFEGSAGWTMCPVGYIIGGFWKNSCQKLNCLENMKCVRPQRPPHQDAADILVNNDDCIEKDFMSTAGWSECDSGYFVRGIYTSDNPSGNCGLDCIEKLKCCKYKENKLISSDTTIDKDWWSCFDGTPTIHWCSVDSNQFITGFYRSSGTLLSDLEVAKTRSLKWSSSWAPLTWSDTQSVHFTDLWSSKWYECPFGYVIGGFDRMYSSCHQGLECIVAIKCIRPQYNFNGDNNYKINNNNCYEYDISSEFDNGGGVNCNVGYFVRGILSAANPNNGCGLQCWEKLKCCKYDEDIIYVGLENIDQNWWSCFDGGEPGGWCNADFDRFITGFFRSGGGDNQDISNLEVARTRKLYLNLKGGREIGEADGKQIRFSCFQRGYKQQINVISATYGTNCPGESDQTNILRDRCDDTTICDYYIDDYYIGDPSPECGKDYDYQYQCVDHKLTGEASGKTVTISCHQYYEIVILSAKYGENCPNYGSDQTVNLRTACDGQRACSYVIDSSTIGDPSPGCYKDYTYRHECNFYTSSTITFIFSVFALLLLGHLCLMHHCYKTNKLKNAQYQFVKTVDSDSESQN